MNIISNELAGKKILILGFGKEGKSTYNLLRREFKDSHLGIADKNEAIKDDELLKNDKNITLYLGDEYLSSIDEYDLVMKSPGIILGEYSVSDKITSQAEIFFKYYSKNIIGVTATKGKTTTVTLLTHILKNAGRDVILLGNIGIPPFDELDKINNDTTIIYELSSYQLEFMTRSPHIAIMLNMYQDHLSTHGTFENYIKAKFNIVKFQDENDIFIYNNDNDIVKGFANDPVVKSKKLAVSQKIKEGMAAYRENEFLIFDGEKIYDLNEERNLIGDHNTYNIMCIIIACKLMNVDNKTITKSINTYVPEPHRLEYVGTYEGIKFYNDSIATIPEPTIEGIKALKEVDTLIVGGYDKGVDYEPIASYLTNSNVRNILCIYETGKMIYDIARGKNKDQNVEYLTGLEEAVKISKRITDKGKICLMSPAAASFGPFKNFEERGEKFKEWVRQEIKN